MVTQFRKLVFFLFFKEKNLYRILYIFSQNTEHPSRCKSWATGIEVKSEKQSKRILPAARKE